MKEENAGCNEKPGLLALLLLLGCDLSHAIYSLGLSFSVHEKKLTLDFLYVISALRKF